MPRDFLDKLQDRFYFAFGGSVMLAHHHDKTHAKELHQLIPFIHACVKTAQAHKAELITNYADMLAEEGQAPDTPRLHNERRTAGGAGEAEYDVSKDTPVVTIPMSQDPVIHGSNPKPCLACGNPLDLTGSCRFDGCPMKNFIR